MGEWLSDFDFSETGIDEVSRSLIDFAVSFGLAALILLSGWLIARLLRSIVRRTATGLNQILERILLSEALSDIRITSRAAAILGELTFWIAFFLSILIAAQAAELTAVAGWLNQILQQIPNLAIGSALILVGYIISKIAADQVTASLRATGSQHSRFLGRLAQAAIFLTALIVGLDQMGVEVTFLVALFASIVGAAFVGFSIAFGLGARDFVANILGARIARRELTSGRLVRIGNLQGNLLEITATHLAIDTDQGRTLVPAQVLAVDPIVEIIELEAGSQNERS